MQTPGSNRPGSVPVRENDDDRQRKRRGAIVWGRTPVAPAGGGGRWAATDLLSTLAVILALFGITGYVNAAPLGAVEDSLDTLFEEVWDGADDTRIANTAGSMIEMVRTAREDQRAYNAEKRERSTSQPVVVPPSVDPGAAPTAVGTPVSAARLAGQGAPLDLGGPILIPGNQVAASTPTVRATPTETVAPTPMPTRRVVIGGAPARSERRAPGDDSSVPPAPPVNISRPTPVPQIRSGVATVEPQPVVPLPTVLVPPVETPAATPGATTGTIAEPTVVRTAAPTNEPTVAPTSGPTIVPTSGPTAVPTVSPTETAVPTAPPMTATSVPPTPTTLPATPTPTPTSTTGSVVIRTDAPATGLMTMSNMWPGACATQNVNVFNAGRLGFTTYTLSTAAASSPTALWSDSTNGLQLRVRRGTTVVYDGPISVANLALGASMAPGDIDLLELRICLPVGTGNAVQGQSQTVSMTWTATGGSLAP